MCAPLYECPRCCYSTLKRIEMEEHYGAYDLNPCPAVTPLRDVHLGKPEQAYMLLIGRVPDSVTTPKSLFNQTRASTAAHPVYSSAAHLVYSTALEPAAEQAVVRQASANAAYEADSVRCSSASQANAAADWISMEYDPDFLFDPDRMKHKHKHKHNILWYADVTDEMMKERGWMRREPYSDEIWKIPPSERPKDVLYYVPGQAKKKKEVWMYECPRCLKRTPEKDQMRDHLNRKTPCGPYNHLKCHDIVITKKMRDYILDRNTPASQFPSMNAFCMLFS